MRQLRDMPRGRRLNGNGITGMMRRVPEWASERQSKCAAILKVGGASSDRSSMGFASCACPLPCPNRSTQEGRVPMLESALESKATDEGGTG
jgi:hypothetical protein